MIPAREDGPVLVAQDGGVVVLTLLTVTGRAKNTIVSGGLTIAAREIEDVVARAPGFREGAVVGIVGVEAPGSERRRSPSSSPPRVTTPPSSRRPCARRASGALGVHATAPGRRRHRAH